MFVIEDNNSLAKKTLLDFLSRGVISVTPQACIKRNISVTDTVMSVGDKSFQIKNKRIFVIGAGKASTAMACALEDVLGTDRITAGVVISNDTLDLPKKIEVHEADHPIPTDCSILGAKKILSLKKKFNINENDIVIGLISGGGSALLTYPVSGISLEDKKKLTEILVKNSANGYENTTIKSKISQVKGGRLAEYFYPTQIISLVLSDDNGEATHAMTASGPFTEDTTTYKDALEILERYNRENNIPESIMSYVSQYKDDFKKKNSFSHVHQSIVGSNEYAVESIRNYAEGKGFSVFTKTGMKGDVSHVAKMLYEKALNSKRESPVLFIYGGETTVSLSRNSGRGGRNQELVSTFLSHACKNKISGKWSMASVGTDGVDFIPGVAGGIIDDTSVSEALSRKLDVRAFVNRNDSNTLLKEIGGLIKAKKSTGTNVGDIMLLALFS